MIRDAAPGDAAAIAAIWAPWVRDTAITFAPEPKTAPEVAAMIAGRRAAGQAFLVAEAAGTVLGFVTYAQFRDGAGYRRSMEHTIILSPAAGRRGTGRALMAAMEDRARGAGVHLMMAGISAENPGARAFHEALGYRLHGTIPQAGWKFGRPIDLWLLGKLL
ncbi:MAG: N-acetyltransferase family protein [Rhodobacteraceae bacterium]|nr:N-acetyltransferase family protein [Paracoccaceae bacterium]